MLKVEMTPQLTGFKVTGDYYDLDELYDAVWALTVDDDDFPTGDRPKGNADERVLSTRLLALCYDLRKAKYGSRDVEFIHSCLDAETAEWQGVPYVEKNVAFAVNIVYPEAMFEIMAINYLIEKRQMFLQGHSKYSWPDKSLLDPVICTVRRYQSLVLSAVEKAASKGRFGKIRDLASDYHPALPRMYTQWLDLLDCRWAYYNRKQRIENMSLTVRDIARCCQNDDYLDLVSDIDRCVREQGGHREDYTIHDDWPDPLEW